MAGSTTLHQPCGIASLDLPTPTKGRLLSPVGGYGFRIHDILMYQLYSKNVSKSGDICRNMEVYAILLAFRRSHTFASITQTAHIDVKRSLRIEARKVIHASGSSFRVILSLIIFSQKNTSRVQLDEHGNTSACKRINIRKLLLCYIMIFYS